MRDLGFADSSLMLDLVMLSRRLRQYGRCLLLRNAQPQIFSLIELVGLNRMPGVRTDAFSRALA